MKTFWIILTSCVISFVGFAQDQEQWDSIMAQTYDYNHNMFDSADYAYFIDSLGARFYDVGGCCPEFIPVPGKPVPEHMPYAKYINDTSMWEWKTVKLADFWEEKIYDLKPQYKDTLIRIDGSVIEVPLWIKDPDWVKED